jgi:putative DNA primase/helicase
MISDNSLLEAALSYASCGWPVFPCNPKNKRPLIKGDVDTNGRDIPNTGGVKKASTNPDTICGWWAKWPQAMIGLACGRAAAVFVLDFDACTDPNTGEVFEVSELIDDLERELHCKLPGTWVVNTPRGGRHLYFQMPPDETIGNRAGLLGPGSHIDVRGEGGYVVLPPSVRADGIAYTWGGSQPMLKYELPAKAPPALLDCIRRSGKWTPKAPSPDMGDAKKSAPAPLCVSRREPEKLSVTITSSATLPLSVTPLPHCKTKSATSSKPAQAGATIA